MQNHLWIGKESESMPLFLVRKEVFEWIINKQKNIELRKGKAIRSNEIVF